jgi:hypothetical protein
MHSARAFTLAASLTLAATIVVGAAACGSSSPTSAPPGTAGGSATPEPAAANPAGDIPDTTVYVPFHSASGLIEVKVPQGWAQSSDAEGVVFTDKLNSIRIQEIPAASAPTAASARSMEVPKIQALSPTVKIGDVTAVARKAGAAVEITYTADSAPDAVTGKVVHDAVERYEFFRNGTEVVLTLSGPVGADNVDPWRTVTDSAKWLS